MPQSESDRLRALEARARSLVEAMPYIHDFRGATIVIKYGGNAMIDPALKQSTIRDICLLELVGMNPVVVHGGGPDITRLMKRVGKKSEFVQGLRVTDEETMELTEMVLAGKLNGQLVDLVNRAGGRAVGLSGKDAGLIRARRMRLDGEAPGGGPAPDIGFVGEICAINAEILQVLDEHDFIPIISPIGADAEGNTYNINADTAAAELAAGLKAEKLILMTDVAGILRDPEDPDSLISSISRDEVEDYVSQGVITGGMIPKARACAGAIDRGVAKTHIIDGRAPHAILLEVLTDYGVGTEIVQARRD